MSLLQPGYLWALVGLAVPLAIHLLSRKEGKVIRMGSLRHIRETSSRQFRSIRLNELLLLALRSIVIGLITLLMSGWYINELKDNRKWLIVEPGAESMPKVIAIRDSLRASGYEERYLLTNFPSLDEPPAGEEELDYLARTRELEALALDSAVVIAMNRSVGFKGSRRGLPLNIRWISVEPSAVEFAVSKTVMHADSIFLRMGASTAGKTSFSSYKLPRAKETSTTEDEPGIMRNKQIMKIKVVSEDGFETDKRMLLAALEAIRKEVPEVVQIESVATSTLQPALQADWLFWLSEEVPPSVNGKTVLYQQRHGLPLLYRERPDTYVLTDRLNSEVVINQNFTSQLMRILFPSREEWRRARASDVRSVDDKAVWSKTSVGASGEVVQRGNQASDRYLLVALLLVVVFERMVSYRRRQ